MKVVLASNNQGKMREFAVLLSEFSFDIVAQTDLGVEEIPETGLTFIENALLKARHASRLTGLPALADDSGLVIPALHGAPGIYSARYAGEKSSSNDNINKVLSELKGVPEKERQAYFYCILVFLLSANDPAPIICEGLWSGTILHAPQGAQGFGYDPIFYVASENKSAAELSPSLKNTLSHRALATRLLKQRLMEQYHACPQC